MAVLGGNANSLINKMVDFRASTQAFMEYLGKSTEQNDATESIPPDKIPMYLERLEHYRAIYKNKDKQTK
ncbi:hypothetical protein [Shimwellia blattae]|uniref:Sensor protein BaeS n=1 Tax=Shimwellia blattae (strain ATCC 29907 / DSM 4481 / JCM 1650 / NBRC 105725 / CDC 9005-74) TaxID=630626 RepID=I2BEJ3_SHIBC|nr:hypothetical protein [Shimwellia blattae]AFJ48947.1 sensor protein BaeS [Shimwellia blattae DSM 4481 = NBRC 105725]GAB81781.1 hypothetical protein YibT [Shimwellia blattae DSM 4481 = NBRC 105725]VDY66432.1 Uncharacterised protein [Shimwellia blattae]VEC28230.1 Uncharacterised protein [Shimwellia blattae]